MNEGTSTKRENPDLFKNAFSSGYVTATGERVFVPLRKRQEVTQSENGKHTETLSPYVDLNGLSPFSKDDIKLIRLQNKIEVEGDDLVGPISRFESIGLHHVILQKLYNKGIVNPTPIQMQGIPLILSRRDVIIHSDTGSGKTLAYLIPLFRILEHTLVSSFNTGPISIIIAPTRELAKQIVNELSYFLVSPLSLSFTPMKSITETLDPHLFTPDGRFQHRVLGLWGGEHSQAQHRLLNEGVDVIVCTPGRLIDIIQKQWIQLNHISYFVIDEADKAVDIEMENQIRAIVNQLPSTNVQTVLCSATFPISVQRLINSCVYNPITVHVNSMHKTKEGLSTNLLINTIVTSKIDRFDILLETLRSIPFPPVLIFVNSIQAIEKLVTLLRQEQFHCCGIHSEYSQDVRDAIIRAFKENGIDILVCSSLLERGMDFTVDEVILYEVPDTIEKLKHRAGRTGRAGKKGRVTVLITKECKIVREYRRLLRESHQFVPPELDSLVNL